MHNRQRPPSSSTHAGELAADWLPRLTVSLACGLALLIPHGEAEACSDPTSFYSDMVNTDAPDCLDFVPGSATTQVLQAMNDCNKPVKLTLESCKPNDCTKTSLTVEPDSFDIVHAGDVGFAEADFSDGDSFELDWTWELPDSNGNVRTSGTYSDNATTYCPNNNRSCTASTGGNGPSPAGPLFFGAFVVIGRIVSARRR